MEYLPIIRQAIHFNRGDNITIFPYYVSNCGDIYNQKLKKLKPWLRGTRGTKYRTVRLCGMNFSINRIVASTFCRRSVTEDANEVDHINGNSLDDRAVNLRWVTRSENERHKHKLKKKGGSCP